MTWICANCTARHEQNDPPCRQCGHEQFAQLDAKDTVDEIGGHPGLEWACKECGERHVKNSPPCKRCGNAVFEPVSPSTDTPDEPPAEHTEPEGSWNWLNPPGPFKGLRKWLIRITWGSLALVILLALAAPTWGGDGTGLVLFYFIAVLPELLLGVGITMAVDNVLGYLKS